MKYLAVFLILSIFQSLAFPAELRAKLELDKKETTVIEGDLVSGVIKVWPIENAEPNELNKLLNKNLLGKFQVLKINSISPSENNADVIEVLADFIVKPSKNSESTIVYRGQTIVLENDEIKIIPLAEKAKDFYVANQSLTISYLKQILGVLIVSIIGFASFKQGKKLYSKYKKRESSREEILRKYYVELFKKAETRKEFEKIYADKKIWEAYLTEISPPYYEFYKIMEAHQYRPDWGEEILFEVKNHFEVIRGSFK